MGTEIPKPCPFCGNGFVTPAYHQDGRISIQCRTAGCEAQGPIEENYNKAMKKWNRRSACVLDSLRRQASSEVSS